MAAHAQLQINQSGAWRSVLSYDPAEVPVEFMKAAEDLVRLSGTDAALRVVRCEPGENGAPKASGMVLARWTRATGWSRA